MYSFFFFRKMWVILILTVFWTTGKAQFSDTSNWPQDRFDQGDTSTRPPWGRYDERDPNSGFSYKPGSPDWDPNSGSNYRPGSQDWDPNSGVNYRPGSQDWDPNSGVNYRGSGNQDPNSGFNFRGNQDREQGSGFGYNRNPISSDTNNPNYGGGFRSPGFQGDNVIIKEA